MNVESFIKWAKEELEYCQSKRTHYKNIGDVPLKEWFAGQVYVLNQVLGKFIPTWKKTESSSQE